MPQTLYIIDGYAQIFRAYYAIRNGLRSPVTSEPTHAVYGFTAMLLKLLGTLKPDYVLVALDAPGNTFRDDIYADYKGTRNQTPDDLIVQIPRVKEMITYFGIPTIGVPGLEADDVIATVVERIMNSPEHADVHIRIVSKDKDLEQLLCDRVSLYDIHTETIIDVPTLFENKGIRPDQVVDYLSLIGDTVDNVPGVAGIGPKTAAQLIQEHGSLDGIYAAIETIKGKKRENLESARGHLPLTRTLVTLKRDADFPFSLTDTAVRPASVPPLLNLCKELGFKTFQEHIVKLYGNASPGLVDALVPESIESPSPISIEPESSVEHAPASDTAETALDLVPGHGQKGSYYAITMAAQLADLVETLASQKLISVDTETTGLDRHAKLCGLSLSWEVGTGVYVPVRSPEPAAHLSEAEVVAALRPILSDPAIGKCGHNMKFDAGVLLRSGITVRGIVFDSFLASTLVNPARQAHKLDNLAESVLGYTMVPITDLIGPAGEQGSMETVPLALITSYAAEDADIALRLYQVLEPKLAEMGMANLMIQAEAPLTGVLATMESNGIICDPAELDAQRGVLAERVVELRSQIFEVVGEEFGLDLSLLLFYSIS
jgi:DNA polymerase-1